MAVTMKKARTGRALSCATGKSDDKFLTVLILNPLWRFAASGPGLVGCGIAVLGSHFGAGCASGTTTSCRKHVIGSQTIFGNQVANLAHGVGKLALACFLDLLLQFLSLLQQFLVRAHGMRSEERRVGKECRSRW